MMMTRSYMPIFRCNRNLGLSSGNFMLILPVSAVSRASNLAEAYHINFVLVALSDAQVPT